MTTPLSRFKRLLNWLSSNHQQKSKPSNTSSENFPKLPLTLELVPHPCWYSNLRSLLSHDEWHHLRTSTYSRANGHCQTCWKKTNESLECHEIWHYDDVTKTQILRGLIALCSDCHHVKHMGFANATGQGEEAILHLEMVNRMTRTDATAYIDDCFSLWNYRNTFRWSADLSWLAEQGVSIPNASRNHECTRLEPLRINFVATSPSYPKQGFTNPHEFWPYLTQFCEDGAPIALEFILPIHRGLEDNPITAKKLVAKYIEQHLLVDDLYAQANILLPNPFNERMEEDRKCLGLCYAHVLISLLPIASKRRFSAINQNSLTLLKGACPHTYPNYPGQYQVHNDVLIRWLTKTQLEVVWKQNAGKVPDLLFETRSSSQYAR